MPFLSKPYLSGIVLVTYIFAETCTYYLPQNSCKFMLFAGITFGHRRSVFPEGRLQIQKRKAARRSFL